MVFSLQGQINSTEKEGMFHKAYKLLSTSDDASLPPASPDLMVLGTQYLPGHPAPVTAYVEVLLHSQPDHI